MFVASLLFYSPSPRFCVRNVGYSILLATVSVGAAAEEWDELSVLAVNR
jgi:hypothetical protein